jgi:hypothetical protein
LWEEIVAIDAGDSHFAGKVSPGSSGVDRASDFAKKRGVQAVDLGAFAVACLVKVRRYA